MKKILLASACIFALAAPTAFAQTSQPTGGASSQGNVGPGACRHQSKCVWWAYAVLLAKKL
jgi:opacity protein-like surface antigen